MGEKRRFLFVQSRDLLHILRGGPSDLVGERLLILQKGISGVLDAVRRIWKTITRAFC